MPRPRHHLAPFLLLAGLATAVGAVPAQAQVTIQLGQPGYYGPVYPNGIGVDQLLYPQPVVIQPGYGNRYRYGGWNGPVQPLYLRVPPGQAKNWRKHCQRYGACNRPVYFVRDSWYDDYYGKRYRQPLDNRYGPGPGIYINPGWNNPGRKN